MEFMEPSRPRGGCPLSKRTVIYVEMCRIVLGGDGAVRRNSCAPGKSKIWCGPFRNQLLRRSTCDDRKKAPVIVRLGDPL